MRKILRKWSIVVSVIAMLAMVGLGAVVACGGGSDKKNNNFYPGGDSDGDSDASNDAGDGGDGDTDTDGDADLSDPKGPYMPNTMNIQYTYTRTDVDAGSITIPGGFVGTTDIGGKSYGRFQIGDTNATQPRYTEMWINHTDTSTWEFKGGEAYSSQIVINDPTQPLINGTLDNPMTINENMATGSPVAVDDTGTATIAGIQTDTHLTGTYSLLESSTSVTTGLGTIEGCKHFQGSFQLGGSNVPAVISALTMSGDVWYHPTYGLVSVTVHRAPFPDMGVSMTGSSDYADLPGGYRLVQKMGVVDGVSSTNLTLDTYDLHQAFDADKDTHAKMLLEIRYVDETLAKTSEQPGVSIEFGTVWGYFPATLEPSALSYFHPEENHAGGYQQWIAFVDQAAKNETTNGIAYHITVYANTVSSPVRVTARIIYKLYQP